MLPNLAQTGTAGAFALSLVVVLNGVLAHFHISMTTDVSNALVAMLAILIRDFVPQLSTKPAPGGSPDFLSKGPPP